MSILRYQSPRWVHGDHWAKGCWKSTEDGRPTPTCRLHHELTMHPVDSSGALQLAARR